MAAKKAQFEVYRNAPRDWRWRLRARNGEIIALGESYTTKRKCLQTVDAFARTVMSAKVEEVNS